MLGNATSATRSIWSAERSALLADALRRGGRSRLRVYGESMLPTLWPGEVVEIVSCPMEDVRPGEIVLARREGLLFLHRLIAPCTPKGFLLRGDSMPGADSLFPPDALLGRLVCGANQGRAAAAPALRQLFGTNWFGAKCSRALGMLLCHCGVARRLALKLHSRGQASAREFSDPESTAAMEAF